MNFWDWLVRNGLIAGDWNYYASGAASQDEVKNALNTAIANLEGASAPTAKQEFYTRLQEATGFGGDSGYYARGEAAADEVANLVNVTSGTFKAGTATPPTAAPQVPTAPHPAEPGAPAAPVVGTPTGILAGGNTVKIQQEDGTYRWYQVYQFPPGTQNYVAYQFNNVQQVEATFGSIPGHFTETRNYEQTYLTAIASAEEVIGMAGNWNTFSNEIATDAARRAGVNDPGLIGRMMSDPEMQQIMVRAGAGGWSPEQIVAEQRKTNFWKNVLYPGIDKFYGRTTEPEKAWSQYVGNVSPALTELGYKRDADGTFNTQIKKMLDNGIEDQTFLQNVPIFQQAAQNTAFAQVLNARSQQELGKSITFGDWFGLLKGEGADEIQKVAEGAVVAYQAQQQQVGLNEQTLQRLIAERDLSEAEARNVFTEVNQAVLATGDAGLGRYGLSRDDIISSAAGIDPESGRSASEVRNLVAKIARENALFDDEKVGFYLGFDPTGRPTRPGLQALAPEGA